MRPAPRRRRPNGAPPERQPMTDPKPPEAMNRREFLRVSLRCAASVGAGAAAGAFIAAGGRGNTVWQIDPAKCIQCGNCATYCVLSPSAVKVVHSFHTCGYCERCFGYFQTQATDYPPGRPGQPAPAAAEAQLCPTGAIRRRCIEPERYEYSIDEDLCIACGKCVKGCNAFGNGAFSLQVVHDRCVNCNECAIAAACPGQAFVRLPAERPYLLKDEGPHT